MKKVVKSKVVAQKWLWWSDNGKIFNDNNSGSSRFLSFTLHSFSPYHVGDDLRYTRYGFIVRLR